PPGGALAAAVSNAGGFGLVGGGYGDRHWLTEQLAMVQQQRFGVGFITWALQPDVLTFALEHQPQAVMLSFGNPAPFAAQILDSGAQLICQCQTLQHVKQSMDAGANIIVAQGSEAGGHGAQRGTMSLVPECADFMAGHAPDVLLLAAGGIADGRGLAAALMLGADGVLVGTRLWASTEALVADAHHRAILSSSGDDTIRTGVADIARELNWPAEFSARIQRNQFVQRWHGNEPQLQQQLPVEAPKYRQAFAEGDVDNAAVWFGEAAGLINTVESAADIIANMSAQAADCLRNTPYA
ncbi:MAG: nitronate monooxygenase, partial [Pseudomonadota bacterium]